LLIIYRWRHQTWKKVNFTFLKQSNFSTFSLEVGSNPLFRPLLSLYFHFTLYFSTFKESLLYTLLSLFVDSRFSTFTLTLLSSYWLIVNFQLYSTFWIPNASHLHPRVDVTSPIRSALSTAPEHRMHRGTPH
jgi:hypothetical protein